MPKKPFLGGIKPPPPPAPPPKRTEETRKVRLGLDTFVYECSACGEEKAHSTGYMFVVVLNANWLYFCDVNCCDIWEKNNPELRVPSTAPVPDRRGAIAATRAKNAEAT